MTTTTTSKSTSSPSWSGSSIDGPLAPRPTSISSRKQSYTHTFPSRSFASTTVSSVAEMPSSEHRGLSKETLALAKQALHVECGAGASDRTMQFFSGLQWLLDSTVQVEPAHPTCGRARQVSLTEDAMNAFNHMQCGFKANRIEEVDGNLSSAEGLESQGTVRTRNWVARNSVDGNERSSAA